jgi:hypothetical protein
VGDAEGLLLSLGSGENVGSKNNNGTKIKCQRKKKI